MQPHVRVSIAVNNHNYAQFLGAAIDSALAQTYQNVEVIVVDDGSTDASWRLIQSYGARITAVRSENLGQGSAYNLGFERCRGEWMLFLDSDDTLDPTAVAQFLAAADEHTAIVQCRLRKTDAQGQPLGGMVPYTMHGGDVTPIIRRFGHYGGPPASGNFYRRTAIAPYFPMPVQAWRRASDTVPFLLGAFHGRIVSLPGSLGTYRQHSQANARMGLLGNMNRSITDGLHNQQQRRIQAFELLRERSGIEVNGPFEPLPWSVRERVLSWRLEPDAPPIDGPESVARLLRDQWRSVRSWPGYGWADRLLQCAWTAAVALAPRPLLMYVARGNTNGALRAQLQRWFAKAP
jgi:glycosyltransferase involved in cell wall biosynthesis